MKPGVLHHCFDYPVDNAQAGLFWSLLNVALAERCRCRTRRTNCSGHHLFCKMSMGPCTRVGLSRVWGLSEIVNDTFTGFLYVTFLASDPEIVNDTFPGFLYVTFLASDPKCKLAKSPGKACIAVEASNDFNSASSSGSKTLAA